MSGDAGPGLRGQERFEFTYELQADDFRALLVSQQAVLKAEPKKSGLVSFPFVVSGLAIFAVVFVLLRAAIVSSGQLLPFVLGIAACLLVLTGYQKWAYPRNYARKLFDLSRLG